MEKEGEWVTGQEFERVCMFFWSCLNILSLFRSEGCLSLRLYLFVFVHISRSKDLLKSFRLRSFNVLFLSMYVEFSSPRQSSTGQCDMRYDATVLMHNKANIGIVPGF